MLDIQSLKKVLPQISDQKLLEAIAGHGRLETFNPGDQMMEPGQYIKMIPIVISGSIKILRPDAEEKEIFLYYLEKGDTCALSLTCCNTYMPSEIKAVAEEESTIIFIPVKLHDEWLLSFRQWKDFVAMTYQKRFQELLRAIDEIAFKKMDERILNYLENKARQLEINELHITHHQIAKELGTSREVVSRLLKQLENEGMVTLGRNKITLPSIFQLNKLK